MVSISDLVKDKFYRNIKNGKKYKLLNFATHSETLEKMVVYLAMYDDFSLWVRPLELFITKFELWID